MIRDDYESADITTTDTSTYTGCECYGNTVHYVRNSEHVPPMPIFRKDTSWQQINKGFYGKKERRNMK